MANLKAQAISGLSWSFLSQFFRQGMGFVITAVLARLLTPGDFGLVGMATVFTGFAAIFNDLGIGNALIQRQNIDDRHLSSAFWLNVFVGFALALIFALGAPLIAAFYQKSELTPLLQLLSLNFILASFTIIQQSLFAKKLDFRSLMVRDVIATVTSGVIGIGLAYNGYGAWALVYQTLSYTVLNGVMLWILSGWRPKFAFSKQAIRDIFNFSAHMTGFNVLNYLARNIDYLLVGKFLGARDLGLYTLAYKLMLVPLQNVTYTIAKVSFPAFSKIQDDLPRVRKGYLKIVQGIALITFPMMAGLGVSASEFIRVVYGQEWLAVIPMVQVLCLSGMLQSISAVSGSVYQSQGRPDVQLKLSLFLGLPSVVLAVVLGMLYNGIFGVVVFYTIRTVIMAYISQNMVNGLIGLKWGELLGCMSKSVLVSAAVGLAAFGAGWACAVFHVSAPGAVLAAKVTSGLILYAAIAYPMHRQEIDELILRRKAPKEASA